MIETYLGGCHCRAIRFEVDLDLDAEPLILCDCSICRMKGILHAIVPPERFRLLCGQQMLTEYRFNTGVAVHRFCSRCGIHPFYTPRSHPDDVDVNVNCLDALPRERARIEPFHGAQWEQSIDALHQQLPPTEPP